MALLVTDNEVVREKPSVGMHDGVCIFVVDIGTHVEKTEWGDKLMHKIVICWELDQLLTEGDYAGKPFMVSKRYTFTLFQKGNLSKDLESWFSKKMSDETRKNGFDLETLVGRHCTLNMVESENGKYINIGSVLPAQKSNVLKPVCTEVPEWINKLIATSLEKTSNPQPENGEPLPQENYGQAGDTDPLPF